MMRSFIVMGMFAASLAHAGWGGFEEIREFSLDLSDTKMLKIDAGAGSLKVRGIDGGRKVDVEATIQVDENNARKAAELVEKHLILTLEKDGNSAVLTSHFKDDIWSLGSGGSVALVVEVPVGTALHIEDSSGSIKIDAVGADVKIGDGSGSIKVSGVASLDIDDGSGSINVDRASGDVSIIDGSGSIRVTNVNGTVTIDDGSGSITVSDIGEDLIIEDDGSGGLSYQNVQGVVEQDT